MILWMAAIPDRASQVGRFLLSDKSMKDLDPILVTDAIKSRALKQVMVTFILHLFFNGQMFGTF